MSISSKIDTYINESIIKYPEYINLYTAIQNLYNKKLYHQLSELLLTYLNNIHFNNNNNLILLYDSFIKYIENDIKPINIIILASYISKKYENKLNAIEFLTSIENIAKKSIDATILHKTEIANLHLLNNNFNECIKLLDTCRVTLESSIGIDSMVHSTFYRVSMNYYKIRGQPSEYYKQALLYLGYTSSESIEANDRLIIGSDIALAAIIGEGVYNFGELLQHGILKSLIGTSSEWLVQFIQALYSADINQFEKILQINVNQPLLKGYDKVLHEKIRLMCLMELIFKRDSDARNISFEDVLNACKVDANSVEYLLMRAMAVGLIRATIDEVDAKVLVTWVQPRVLDMAQIASLRDKLASWGKHVNEMANMMENTSPELFAELGK